MGKKSISHKISDEDALKLIYEFNSKLFYAGEKTIWYNNKAKLYDVSVSAISSIVCRLTRKYLIVVEDEETWADS